MYEIFHCKEKTAVRPSYLYNGNSYTDKTASFYWDGTPDGQHMVWLLQISYYRVIQNVYYSVCSLEPVVMFFACNSSSMYNVSPYVLSLEIMPLAYWFLVTR